MRKAGVGSEDELAGVLEQLKAREPIFHRPDFGVTRADFERMTAPEFCEVGASGRRYSREFVVDELERRFAQPHVDVWEASEFRCQRLGEDVFLLTYTLLQDGSRLTRRTTIWQRTADDWKILFHQGTIVVSDLRLEAGGAATDEGEELVARLELGLEDAAHGGGDGG